MAKQTFTTGQVLTAAQMTSLQQTAMGGGSATAKTASYTLVAADAGTTVIMNSASATTITVNTSLFSAGDTVFIQNIGAGVSTITAGTATVNTASSLALAQYASGDLYFTAAGTAIFSKADGAAAGSTGLTFINKFEPTSVSEQNMNNIFSSTYKYYKIVWSVVMSDAAEFQFRLRVSGSDATTNYNISQIRTNGPTTATQSQEVAIGAIPVSFGGTSGIKQGEMIVFNPFTATKTGIDYHHYSENASSGVCGALHTDATSYTGCNFYPATGTITGEISVYGFNRS